jgi:hypothetical protein
LLVFSLIIISTLYEYLSQLDKIGEKDIEVLPYEEDISIHKAFSPPPKQHLKNLQTLLKNNAVLVIPAFDMDHSKAEVPDNRKRILHHDCKN